MRDLIDAAPAMMASLDNESREHFAQLTDILDQAELPYEVNQRLVRGLDYYSHTVFEWVTDTLGSQGTVCAGGRYDGLIEQLGGKPGHAAGFAMGCERLVAMLQDQGRAESEQPCDVYLAMRGDNSSAIASRIGEGLRDTIPGLKLTLHAGAGSFKSQMRKADKSGARVVLILGESEIESGNIALKHLREDKPQLEIAQSEIAAQLVNFI